MDARTCAYLVMEDPGDYVTDYDLSYAAMAELGWTVETVAWRNPGIDWDRYAAVYPCTAWDYPDHIDEFLQLLQRIEASSAALVNPLPLLLWNTRKTYLRDLQQRGARIVPSLWLDTFDAAAIPHWFDALDTTTVVLKPQVGANAQHIEVLHRQADWPVERLAATFSKRPLFVQPFVPSIQSDGEFSLFYFGARFSHAIRKLPASGDFRSQEEYGADIQPLQAEAALRRAGDAIIKLISPPPVYVRIDLVRGEDDSLQLMELELVEPSLYLRTDPKAAARFAAAFDQYVSEVSECV